METISNLATTAATTASKLIYGEQPAATNETAAKEPLSGEQGKGTPTDPFDHGNLGRPIVFVFAKSLRLTGRASDPINYHRKQGDLPGLREQRGCGQGASLWKTR